MHGKNLVEGFSQSEQKAGSFSVILGCDLSSRQHSGMQFPACHHLAAGQSRQTIHLRIIIRTVTITNSKQSNKQNWIKLPTNLYYFWQWEAQSYQSSENQN